MFRPLSRSTKMAVSFKPLCFQPCCMIGQGTRESNREALLHNLSTLRYRPIPAKTADVDTPCAY